MPSRQSMPSMEISSIVERLDTSIADAAARYLDEFRFRPIASRFKSSPLRSRTASSDGTTLGLR
jgi:hypothetical protein